MDKPVLIRRSDAAELLTISESQLLKWERQGIIEPVSIPGIRAVRYRMSDVQALANNIANGQPLGHSTDASR